MKKNYGLFIGFIVIIIVVILIGVFYVFGNVGNVEYTFNKDGYALYVKENSNYKAQSLSFTNGSSYYYKKSNNKIVFKSVNEGNVSVDESTIVHYTDDSLLMLKNVVGLDLTSIDNDLIFYYNIYKNTNINFDNGGYTITSLTGDKVKFNNMLIRITENKYLFVSDNVRVAIGKDEVIDLGKYAYIEYSDGSIVGVYNNNKNYQSIGEDISIVSGDITIDLADKTISKKGEKYITLSNLVLNSDSNIDLIPQETGKLPSINKPSVDTTISGGEGSSTENNGSIGKPDNNVNDEVVEEEGKVMKVPNFKVVNTVISPIKIDAEIEIIDEDQLITSPTEITIVNNSTLEVVYESSVPIGDTSSFVSTANLLPDTEYTIVAKAGYSIDGVEYIRSFVNKIFRTKAIGVTFEKGYATANSLVVDVVKEDYSDVGSVDIVLYTANGGRVESTTVDFQNENYFEVTFNDLTNNTEYLVVMTNVMCEGLSVDDGYSEEKTMVTLKNAPVVSELNYQVNKRTSTFELSIGNVKDDDYGILGYRYEVFRIDQDMNKELPLASFESNNLKPISVNVDENNLNRGSAYTYRVIVIFNDNEKIIEYVKELGKTMQLDGVQFPTIRFEPTYITWEQINGAIVVEDEYDTIVGDSYRVVYKNSVDVFVSKTITASTTEDVIPIAENGLRANETYTFQVYADLNLKDGNPNIDEAYIGSVLVQTGLPNPLQATYYANLDYGNVFSINVKLSDYQGKDSKLEASTMSNMLVTLYQGSTASGAEAAKIKVVDKFDEAYISSIKSDFYDSQFVITPSFFNLSNADFTEKAYTMKISNVTDYTPHNNEIPIVNDTFSFTTNSYVPDVPTGDQAFEIRTFLNKNYDYSGIPYDPNLEGNTVVGYRVTANYPNDAMNALNMIYHVWIFNPDTGKFEMIPELDRVIPFDESGNVASADYTVGYGTEGSDADIDMLRRGNKFYFSYEVELDLDGDGVKEDLNYPAIAGKDVVLKSQEISCSKQAPMYAMYPSVSNDTSATWKYKILDVDNALETLNLHSFVGNDAVSSSSPIIEVNTEDYKTIVFDKLKSNNFYSIKSKTILTKGTPVKTTVLSQQFLSPISNSLNLTYSADVESNTLAVRINNYDDVIDTVNKISSTDVTISAQGKETKTVSGVKLIDGVAYVNLIDYPEYMNLDLTIGFKVYFDSGNTGFDVPSLNKALQVLNLEGNGNYFAIDKDKLEQSSNIFDSDFTGSFDPETNLINITNKSGKNLVTAVEFDKKDGRGVYYDGNPISFKELKQIELSSDENEVRFNLLVPSISLVNKSNKLDITPLLTSAIFNIDLKMVDGITVQDNLIYMELYTTDDKGLNPVWIKEYSYTPEALKSPITLSNLNPQQNYMAKFYTYILDTSDNTYKKYYLYDADSKKVEEKYNFHTLSNVGVDNIVASFNIESYETKKIRISYSLENIIGYKYIKYELYELVDDKYELMDIEIKNAEAFNYNMSFEIDAAPGNEHGFAYGKFYKIKIIPIGIYTLNGEEIETDLGSKEHEFMLDNFIDPQVSITGSRTEDSITYRVNIKDDSKVISGNVYSVVLKELGTDGEVLYEENNIQITGNTKKFEFDELDYNLEKGVTYVLTVYYLVDLKNSKTDLIELTKLRTVNYGNTVSIGEVSTAKNASDPYAINIVFADSYLLNSIDTVVYSVTSSTIDYFAAGEKPFTTKYNSEHQIYTHTIYVDQNANFKAGNMYTVTMNFYTEGVLVETTEVSYYYSPETGGGE